MFRVALFLTITLSTLWLDSTAQRWKKYRHEVLGGLGATSFMGELGGGNGPGRDLFLDFDGKASRYLIMGGYRYKQSEFISIRGNLTYGRLYGSDALAGDLYRKSRNLSFRSPLVEMIGVGEFYVIREKTNSRYRVRGIKGVFGSGMSAYVFAGVGGFYFNPRGKFVGTATNPGDGKWYSLQKLGTEGQGLPGYDKKYKRIGLCLPFGVGVKLNVSRTISVTLDYGVRYTFTDYLDDVSGDYPDVTAMRAERGDVAAYFSNPAIPVELENGNIFIAGGGTNPVGEQRGNPHSKDAYMFATLALNYKFVSKKTNRPKF